MQVPPADAVPPLAALSGGLVSLRVSAGSLAALPLGVLLEATVAQVGPREAVIELQGQRLTVRPPTGLQVGTVLLVRVPPTLPGVSLELLGQVCSTPPGEVATGAPHSRTLPPPGTREAQRTTPTLERKELTQRAPASVGRVEQAAVSLLDVVAVLSDGRLRVRLEGTEQLALPSSAFTPGGRYVVLAERTPSGLQLRPLPNQPELPRLIAEALLRSTRSPDLGSTVRPLLTELNKLLEQAQTQRTTFPAAVREAAATVRETIRALTPGLDRSPSASELQALVANGGVHYEAKLVRAFAHTISQVAVPTEPNIQPSQPAVSRAAPLPVVKAAAVPSPAPEGVASAASIRETLQAFLAAGPRVQPPATVGQPLAPVGQPAPPTTELPNSQLPATDRTEQTGTRISPTADRLASPPVSTVPVPSTGAERGLTGLDLKGDLLRLLHAVQELGESVMVPVARETLNQIEAHQAVNLLAQETGSPYFLQIPFPDGAVWRTLHLALNPEARRDTHGDRTGSGFRLLMHVPLDGLGETWIDAGITDDRFRAVIYLDQPETRQRVQNELGTLRDELRNDGFSEVLLDARLIADLPARQRALGTAMRAGRPESVSVIDVKV